MLTGSSWATHVVRKWKEKQKGAGPPEQGCSRQRYSQIPMGSSPPFCPSMGSPLQALELPPGPHIAPRRHVNPCPLCLPPSEPISGLGQAPAVALSSPPLTSPSPWSSEDPPPRFIKASGARSGQISGISSTFLQKGLSHSCDFLRATERWGPRCLVLGLSCARRHEVLVRGPWASAGGGVPSLAWGALSVKPRF